MADGIINKYINKFQSAADLIPDDIVKGHSDQMYLDSGQNIYNTSNSVKDYHTTANADLSNRISNKIGENYGNLAQAGYNVASPLASVPMSFAYDGKQAYDRMEPGSGIMGFGKAFLDESPFSAAYQRALGVADPFFNQFGMTTVKDNSLESNLSPTNINFTDILQQDVNKDIYNGYGYNYNDVDAMTADEQAQLPIDPLTPQQTMFGKAKDLASAGIGKAGKLGMDAFNMLKNNNPIGFLTSGLASLGDMFEYKGGDVTVDENGNIISAADLNKMNARGGYYTDAARNARNRTKSLAAFRARGATDSKRYNDLLLQEIKQEKARAEAEATLAAQAAAGTHTRGGTAIDFGDYYNSDGSANTSSSMANNPSQSYGGPRAKGGFIGYKNGGLVKMFKGKL